ncbi:MAG: GYF domain-containing protein [Chthoniobacteraceae bacterium]
MDIQILRDGKQTGPYTEDAVHELLKQGSVLVNDLAWRPGLSEWVPLVNVLYPAATREPAPPVPAAPAEAPAAEPREPATARQKAFLDYVGIAFAADVSKEDASLLVNEAMEHPKDPTRLARWNEERLHLHPDLFATEIQARKENRPQRFLEICHGEGAPLFEKVTKAHCQVLVSHLDVHAPNWDTHEQEAAAKYFFPALAEKFPQLLTEQGKAKFKVGDKSAAPARPPKSSPVAVRSRPHSGPTVGKVLYAMARGVFVGLMILGLLWVGRGFFVSKAPAKKVSSPATNVSSATPAPETPAPPATPESAPESKAAKVETQEKSPEAPVASEPAAPTNPEPAMAATESATPAASPALGLFGEAPSPAAAPAAPPSSPARTSVNLTKAVQITLPFGKINVPPGTAVKLVAQNGAALTVRYLDHEIVVPASSTDLGTDPTTGNTSATAQ